MFKIIEKEIEENFEIIVDSIAHDLRLAYRMRFVQEVVPRLFFKMRSMNSGINKILFRSSICLFFFKKSLIITRFPNSLSFFNHPSFYLSHIPIS